MEPDEEYEVHVNGLCEAAVFGSATDARAEIKHYASIYEEDGDMQVFRVFRDYTLIENWRDL